jgi:hypothetical protein
VKRRGRKGKNGFHRPTTQAVAIAPQAAPEPLPPPEPPKPKRAFRSRSLPLSGGVDVKITGKEAFEEDVVIKYEDDLVIIATGEAAASIRAQRNPLAALVPVRVAPEQDPLPRVRPDRRPLPRAKAGNVDDFLRRSSESKLDVDASELEEDDDTNVVSMQENGMPRSPRDRTIAQRRNLVIHDRDGNPAQALTLEAIAKA